MIFSTKDSSTVFCKYYLIFNGFLAIWKIIIITYSLKICHWSANNVYVDSLTTDKKKTFTLSYLDFVIRVCKKIICL